MWFAGVVRIDEIERENCPKEKNKIIQALVTKNTYEFRDTVETIIDCMKPGTYTNPGIPLYHNDIDRCEYETMANDGIVSFGMSW